MLQVNPLQPRALYLLFWMVIALRADLIPSAQAIEEWNITSLEKREGKNPQDIYFWN